MRQLTSEGFCLHDETAGRAGLTPSSRFILEAG